METTRLEAFSDAVLAIVLTIMVLELRAPHEPTLAALRPLVPVFGSYLLSFVFIGIYWNNHHHLFQATDRVSGSVLWANLHLLFWLSLVPFVTAWMGENGFGRVPVALYAVVLLMAGVAFTVLVRSIVAMPHANEALRAMVGSDRKGRISNLAYALAIPAALFVHPAVAGALFLGVTAMWLVPDRRIEEVLMHDADERR
ncbi:MAG TPA: TMEM175 family protein [Rubricoccaceae bacterium]|jgi:uncharacterized membrane protein